MIMPLVILFIAMSIISYLHFNILNPIASGIAVIRACFSVTVYIEAKKSPVVMIMKPGQQEFYAWMKEKGHHAIKRMSKWVQK